MKTLTIQIENEADYQLFLSFAKRLNCKIISEEIFESNPEEEISDELKLFLKQRLMNAKNNKQRSVSSEDYDKKVKQKYGWK